MVAVHKEVVQQVVQIAEAHLDHLTQIQTEVLAVLSHDLVSEEVLVAAHRVVSLVLVQMVEEVEER